MFHPAGSKMYSHWVFLSGTMHAVRRRKPPVVQRVARRHAVERLPGRPPSMCRENSPPGTKKCVPASFPTRMRNPPHWSREGTPCEQRHDAPERVVRGIAHARTRTHAQPAFLCVIYVSFLPLSPAYPRLRGAYGRGPSRKRSILPFSMLPPSPVHTVGRVTNHLTTTPLAGRRRPPHLLRRRSPCPKPIM